jgi:hypothetical protein
MRVNSVLRCEIRKSWHLPDRLAYTSGHDGSDLRNTNFELKRRGEASASIRIGNGRFFILLFAQFGRPSAALAAIYFSFQGRHRGKFRMAAPCPHCIRDYDERFQ